MSINIEIELRSKKNECKKRKLIVNLKSKTHFWNHSESSVSIFLVCFSV